MPDAKITALTAISVIDPAVDPLPIVDVSDTAMAASGTTKKITINQILGASGTATLASATITGDLTVDTSTLKVDSANNRVGINTATPTAGNVLDIVSATSNNFIRFTDSVNATGYLGIASTGSAYLHGNNNKVSLSCSTSNTTPTEQFRITNPGVFEFLDGVGGTRMTLNSTGLGVGVSPGQKLDVVSSTGCVARIRGGSGSGQSAAFYVSNTAGTSTLAAFGDGANMIGGTVDSSAMVYAGASIPLVFYVNSAERLRIDSSGNVGLGVTTFGTSAARVLSIATGTEPTTGPTGTVQWFTSTRSANNTIPAIFTEGSGVTNAAITNVTVTNKIALKVNGTIYYLLATTSAA